jgi:hypothetical protein
VRRRPPSCSSWGRTSSIRHVSHTRNDTATFGVELETSVPEPVEEPALAAMPPLVPERSRK